MNLPGRFSNVKGLIAKIEQFMTVYIKTKARVIGPR